MWRTSVHLPLGHLEVCDSRCPHGEKSALAITDNDARGNPAEVRVKVTSSQPTMLSSLVHRINAFESGV
eukprot:CAMPEP_0170129088 /NCGR_PEP_ID=MMETSP0020_2-20130122/21623_1 /TAXON_ID=98059 /ORGANISM="Dinobryon sp., Strain UTEXLB2267" /LENGTH=68 /DNA_ID=CAMNT_0010363263 /DNA_START=1 /DNA_END=204 /DNA_ORIENTATION=-